jgi:hypothetical protein
MICALDGCALCAYLLIIFLSSSSKLFIFVVLYCCAAWCVLSYLYFFLFLTRLRKSLRERHIGLLCVVVLMNFVEATRRMLDLHLNLPQKNSPPSCKILFSGCGTSGRIGFLAARHFNGLLADRGFAPLFTYTVSGGDAAIVASDELPEDRPDLGVDDFKQKTKGATHVLFVGISCGLSAPYVAGQLAYTHELLEREGGGEAGNSAPLIEGSVAIGFNPASLARHSVVPAGPPSSSAQPSHDEHLHAHSTNRNPAPASQFQATGLSQQQSGSDNHEHKQRPPEAIRTCFSIYQEHQVRGRLVGIG